MSTFFVDVLQQYGYPALWLIVFVAAAGAPISGSLLLFASGAFAALGDFNIFILFPLALSAAVMGDNLGYFIGRRVGTALIGWLERQKRFRFITPQALERGRAYFRRKTGWTIFITRFLIVVLGGPINLARRPGTIPLSSLSVLGCQRSDTWSNHSPGPGLSLREKLGGGGRYFWSLIKPCPRAHCRYGFLHPVCA